MNAKSNSKSGSRPLRSATSSDSPHANLTRGYQKLASAAAGFHFDFRGRTVLDIGSSTGGFTAYALDHGASRVIAIEKGTNQMAAPLCFDPRIELHEKTDIFSVSTQPPRQGTTTPAAVSISGKPDIIVADVSFISLTKVLKYAKMNLARSNTDYLVMVKPQFEARPDQLIRGVVKNSAIRRQILKDFERWLSTNNFRIVKKADNELPGRAGNLERFYWLRSVGP